MALVGSRTEAAKPAVRGTAAHRKGTEGTAAKKAGQKRGPRDPIKQLGLAEPSHALLVAPADYIDCRAPITRAHRSLVGVEQPRVFMFRFAGEARGRDAQKNTLWSVPQDTASLSSLQGKTLYDTRSTMLTLHDEDGAEITLWVFGLPSAWVDLRPGDPVWALGTLERFGSKLGLSLQQRVPEHARNTVWTRYAGKQGAITAERVAEAVRKAMASAESVDRCAAWIVDQVGRSQDDLVAEELAGEGFDSLRQLLLALHAPLSVEQGRAAVRLARRLSVLAMAHAAQVRHVREPSPRAPIPLAEGAVPSLAQQLAQQGRALTSEQLQAVNAIAAGLRSEVPLSALLSGDVGTGKTLTYLVPAVAAHLAGAQVAIVAPVRLLADQISRELVTRFGTLIKAVQRVEAGDSIDDPAAILVGTQGLLNAAQRSSYIPDFLVIDEQHRLSTEQREAAVASHTHRLEVSATPIPRTLATSIYRSISQLQLASSPVRKAITSEIVPIADKQRVLGAIRAALARGERCAVVYPRVSPAADTPAHECVSGAFASFLKAFPEDAVMIHGELPQEQIETGLQAFREGRRRLAIASTILEIGIDVPSLSVMVVRDAGNFGMSQLHQLRGRLARNGGRGEFLMVVDDTEALAPDTLKRLQVVRGTLDGYAIAEQDLLLRGFGDLDGQAQSGSSSTLFKLLKLSAEDFVGQQIKARRRAQAAAAPPAAAPATAVGQRKAWTLPTWARKEPPAVASGPQTPESPGASAQAAALPPGQPSLF